jgi:hypothetical protein
LTVKVIAAEEAEATSMVEAVVRVAEAMRGQLKIYRQWSQQIQHGERQWRK